MFRVLSAGGAAAALAAVQVVGPDAGKLLDAAVAAAAFEIMMGAGSGYVSDQMFSLVQNASFHAILCLIAIRFIRIKVDLLVMPQTIGFRFELAAVETDIRAISLLLCWLAVAVGRKMRVLVCDVV